MTENIMGCDIYEGFLYCRLAGGMEYLQYRNHLVVSLWFEAGVS